MLIKCLITFTFQDNNLRIKLNKAEQFFPYPQAFFLGRHGTMLSVDHCHRTSLSSPKKMWPLATMASLGNLLQIQFPRPHSRSAESEILGV